MNRKELLQKASLALVTTGILSQLNAEDHNHGGMSVGGKSKYSKAMMAAIHCKLNAQICLDHCLVELSKGDKSLAACAMSTKEVITVCDSFIQLASSNSKSLKKLAAVCIDVCEACVKECDKHAKHHDVCKQCKESCLACIKELKLV